MNTVDFLTEKEFLVDRPPGLPSPPHKERRIGKIATTSPLSSATGRRSNGGPFENANVAEREVMTENTNAHLPRNLEQAKKRAYSIKERLGELGHTVGLSHVFEVLAVACGMRNWNTYQNTLKSGADWNDEPTASTPPTAIPHDLTQFRTTDGKVWPAPVPPKTVEWNFATPGRARNRHVPASLGDVMTHLNEIQLICDGEKSTHHDVNWDQKDAEFCLHTIKGHIATIVRLLDDWTVKEPVWTPVKRPPTAGGPYVVGGYITNGSLRSFHWAFASLTLTVDGPEWRHWDKARNHIPIEFWTELPAHPEHYQNKE
ncbi:hypothetical protein [Rhizobium sp. MHM7A]|uniref:hypothetical protein n=1 Tax=Rhizobium sp. MHM7A TaxID=2583233 RepID=UPI0011063821|nr:hypothetical protein [Rhizobium sp. MHM7A]TLX16388.1 hypothetical protein FFR93_03380 [Rhizobium sp. MHM7A]